MRANEAELKKIYNQDETLANQLKAKKEELMGFQFNSMNKQKAVDTCKTLV